MVRTSTTAYSLVMPFKILLAEDNQTFANSVSWFVGLIHGAQLVAHAKDGDEALEQALELSPDLILMDIAMPKQSGLQVARQLQLLERPSRIVFLSMHSDSSYREAARKAGGMHFVTKGNFVAELLPLIEKMVKEQPSSPLAAVGAD